jgi:hypothetical protein
MLLHRPMKIAYVYDAVYPFVKGGVEKRIWELAVRLVRRGHEVHLYGMQFWEGPAVIEREGVVLHGVCAPLALYTAGRRSIAQAVWFGWKVIRPFLQVKIGAIVERFDDHVLPAASGEENEGNVFGACAYCFKECDPVHAGHLIVRYDDVERGGFEFA